MLQESAATLQDVAGREKYLGAQLGCLSVLHTWGRQLQFHPHVHCVVPAGGLRPEALRWCPPKSAAFFLPQSVLAARFRTRLRAALQLAPDAADIPAVVWRQKWVVDVQPVGSGQAALTYLSAYVYHTALGSQRILSLLAWQPPTRQALPAPSRLCPGCGAQLLWIGTLVRAPP